MKKVNKFKKGVFSALFALLLVGSVNTYAGVSPEIISEDICRCHTAGTGICLDGHAISFREQCECGFKDIPGVCINGDVEN